MRRLALWSLLVVGLALMAGCDAAAADEPSPTPAAPSADAAVLSPAFKGFGFNLFHQVEGRNSGRNVVMSPLSVALALGMTADGAAGDTRAAMLHTLGLDGMSPEDIDAASAALLQSLTSADPRVQLALANSLWARQGFAFDQAFLDRTRQFFNARVSELDFNDPAAPDVINAWVRDNTAGLIDGIVDQISPEQVLYLINAVYFKGQWATRFDPALTADRPFTLADGSVKSAPMMSRGDDLRYIQTDALQAVSLPYGDGRFSMVLALPAAGRSLDDLVSGLDGSGWTALLAGMSSQQVDVSLPRFTMQFEAGLIPDLSALGMGIAFDPNNADFSAMHQPPPGLVISEVKHKAFIEVNEEGTEAAAVTSVGIRTTAARQRASFVANRPFLFAIQDNTTGAVLFLGTVNDPS
jgi:serpin B